MKRCLCGDVASGFEVYGPDLVDPTQIGKLAFFGVIAIVGGEPCCSAFTSRKYQLDTREKAQTIADELNAREDVDLGVEAGVL